ncbi:DUF1311 domain-containing protein [Pseudothauera nasutitermitis]|uniref:DUF1311 domain-containing protein n=1 Tax=Pseudothauera nasutitermitis TaxID=2565930 RepID=A0A4S4B6G1_9RHOO|nr:lysozyme inhibitor LprI family protein [Pseudothauera nasutitermitis]THF67416.1 DUF1311 domain-containing protein [Pseudothauera nasutitermitis]
MPGRQISALAFVIWLFAVSSYAVAESQMEYAEKTQGSWLRQNELMENSYNRLLLEAEAELNEGPAQQLIKAKKQWEDFRKLFCKSVSSIYGGQWASVHESECRAKLAKQLQNTADSYGW